MNGAMDDAAQADGEDRAAGFSGHGGLLGAHAGTGRAGKGPLARGGPPAAARLAGALRARGVRVDTGGESARGPAHEPGRWDDAEDDGLDLTLVRVDAGDGGADGLVSLDELDAAFEPRKRPRLRIAAGAAVVLTLVAIAIALVVSALQPSASQTVPLLSASPQAGGPPASAVPQAAPVMVHVVGSVHAPGVYELPAGARVADAIQAAGGGSEGADVSALNLARVLRDGERIAVPRAGEAPPPEANPAGGMEPAGDAGEAGSSLVSLNTASQQQLESLPRVGPALAARIVAYREEHGGFSSVEELKQVPGIGDAIFAELEALVTL